MNVDGYYDCLLRLFDKGVEEGFIKPTARDIVISAKTPRELMQKMEVPPRLILSLNPESVILFPFVLSLMNYS